VVVDKEQTMSARALAVSVIAAAAFALAPGAKAADLEGERYIQRGEGPYDEPRYAERYREPPPGYDDDDRDDGPEYGGEPDAAPPYDSSKDGYYPPPRRFDVPSRRADGCAPRWQVRHRLRAEGWTGLHDLDLRGDVAIVRAYRPSGESFTLKIDRCSGEIVDARPDRLRSFGYFQGPRRFGRLY
jgi:hypothetical protein